MPVPIKPVKSQDDKNNFVDYSFLKSHIPHQVDKKVVTASDRDAELLMKIWLEGENKEGDYRIANLGLDKKEVSRLKTYGLISGSTEDVKITERGKRVITVMALGEGNNLEKSRVKKSYLEIMASMDKKGKKGYRIPKFASGNNNLKVE